MQNLRDYVLSLSELYKSGQNVPLGASHPQYAPRTIGPQGIPVAEAHTALIFSPHPDDEVIIGGWPLRLMRECGWRIVNVGVTLGSNPDRKQGRLEELAHCCQDIGFELHVPCGMGLDGVNLATRRDDPVRWNRSVSAICDTLTHYCPRAIFYPHAADFNHTHIGVHSLVRHALLRLGTDFSLFSIETEFWAQMDGPNVLVETSPQDTADLIHALGFHIGELSRNPYHLTVPAWMMDNVRRGAEVLAGQGKAAPSMCFGTLYHLARWEGRSIKNILTEPVFLTATDNPSSPMNS